MDKLKPCPFCGGEAEIEDMKGEYSVICNTCFGASDICETKEETIAAWNRRHETTINEEYNHLLKRLEKEGLPISHEQKKIAEAMNITEMIEEKNNVMQRLEDLLNTAIDDMEKAAYIRAIQVVKTGGKE